MVDCQLGEYHVILPRWFVNFLSFHSPVKRMWYRFVPRQRFVFLANNNPYMAWIFTPHRVR